MKTIILTSAILISMTINAQTVVTNDKTKIGQRATNKQRRKARKALPSYEKNRRKNVKTNVVCSTIFATCLVTWFNVDNISQAVKKD